MSGSAVSIPPEEELHLRQDRRWSLVLRIAASPHFAKAIQPKDILLYITRRSLLAGEKSISEHDIARTVLRRRANFDPNDDSIVRVQVSHIRKKLEAYFATEGQGEDMVVTIPKGAYLPQFELAARPAFLQVPNLVEKQEENAPVTIPLPEASRQMTSRVWVFSSGGLLLGMLLSFVLLGFPRKPLSKAAIANPYAQNPFLKPLFGDGSVTSIVLADSSFSMVEDTLRIDVPVHDYTNKDHLNTLIGKVKDHNLQDALQMVYDRQYTSLGEANVAFKFEDVSKQFGSEAPIRYARYMHARDFEKGNFVLIGSKRGVPWVELFESPLNFSYEKDLQTQQAYFKNKAPQRGESERYVQIDGKESYVDIALVPNLGKNGYVLLIRGLEMEANEAAAAFLFNPDTSRFSFLFGPVNSQQSIEILLRNHATEGVLSGFEIVATRKF